MGKTRTTIEINGKRYDATSGHIIKDKTQSFAKAAPGTHLDGIRRKAKTHSVSPRTSSSANKVHHKTSHSHTLMRHAVKKPHHTLPEETSKARIQLNAHADPNRVIRASHTPKSPNISRFGSSSSVVKKFSPHLSVKEAPSQSVTAVSAPMGLASLVNPFHNALEHATSHTQAKPKKPSVRSRTARKLRISTKALNAASISAAFLLLAGFFAFQNVPNLSMRVAAARSGVKAASLPGYQPAGFSMQGPIKVESGKVTLTYQSNSDQRQFSLSQRSSSWNNETLVEKFIASNRRPYQTFQAKDKTIYMYDTSSATWIDNGVWYQIEGESSLNSDQLLRIASSL